MVGSINKGRRMCVAFAVRCIVRLEKRLVCVCEQKELLEYLPCCLETNALSCDLYTKGFIGAHSRGYL